MEIWSKIASFFTDYPVVSLIIAFFCFRMFFFKPATGKFEEYPGNKVVDCTSRDVFQEQMKRAAAEKKLVVVDFYALWCGPCRYAAPSFGKMSIDFDNVVFLKVDVDHNREVSMENKVNAMPTFILFKDGSMIDRITGWNENKLRTLIERYRN
jgi:thioredoxin 1